MQKYIVSDKYSIKDALVVLNDIAHDVLTLFVVNENEQMVGSLTDGDIRRGLISGAGLEDSVSTIMHRNFKFIPETEFNVARLKEFRES